MRITFGTTRANSIVLLLPVALGTIAFFAVVGPRALNPTNLIWLSEGDKATHYLGWLFFRSSSWSFPIGLNPAYGLEISNAILFSDSNPLFALLFKPFAPLLPEPFQYFGIWLFVCFVFQAWFGWKLTGLISDSITIRVLSTGLYIFAPPFIARIECHLILVGHFLILAGLYLALRPRLERREIAWATLLATTALVHAYLLAMVGLLWLADLTGKMAQKKLLTQNAIIEFSIILSLIGIVCWQAGYFSVGHGTSADGFGYFRMNALSVFDPSGWSYVLNDLPQGPGDYEGFNFLGLGVIFLTICTLPVLLSGHVGMSKAIRKFPVLFVVFGALTLFAITNKVGLGAFSVDYPIPGTMLPLANIFRASGRMFWPVLYAIYFTLIYLITRGNNQRTAAYLLALALVFQIVDTSAAWKGIRKKYMAKPKSTLVTPLAHPFWKEAASKYKKVRWIQPANFSPNWLPLAAYAGTNGLATDAVYLARVGILALEQAQYKAKDAIISGIYEPDSLYVLDDAAYRQAAVHINHVKDALFRVDGFNILAPGWKKCADCSPVFEGTIFPRLKPGVRMPVNQSGNALPYLFKGWSYLEKWGTWSDGDNAEIVLPISGKMSSIRIEANALVSPKHPKQNVFVKIHDVLVLATDLTNPEGNIIDISIPDSVQPKILEKGVVRVQLQFSNAVSPKEIGVNADNRKLALGLLALTVN